MNRTMLREKKEQSVKRKFVYIFCVVLALFSIFPFLIMIFNSTRESTSIERHPIFFFPGLSIAENFKNLRLGSFNVWVGFRNSFLISCSSTLLAVYFSSLTAYAIVAYDWKHRKYFFRIIIAVMMIPTQITGIGFYKMVYTLGLNNNMLMLILPAISTPMTVFFMIQYLKASLPMEIIQSARIDGASEFVTFNKIVLQLMKPAIATQAIFLFVASWNDLFRPMILLNEAKNYTMPIMVSLLASDVYRTNYGTIYLALLITILPLIVIYFALSRYIISGVALGGVKG